MVIVQERGEKIAFFYMESGKKTIKREENTAGVIWLQGKGKREFLVMREEGNEGTKGNETKRERHLKGMGEEKEHMGGDWKYWGGGGG
jgi:hypothetical protein